MTTAASLHAGTALETRQIVASPRWALATLSFSILLSSLGTSIANVGLPTLAAAFSASFQAVQWIVLAYLLSVTALIVSVGRIGDVIGRRKLLLVGIVIFTASSMLCGLAPSLGLLIGARAVQGLGAAIMMALTLAFVADTVPRENTGSAMGLLGMMSAVGTALGPTLGGLLIAGFGWPALFLINVPLGIVALVLTRRHLPADRRTRPGAQAGFDYCGTLLLALTLAAYALAATIGRGRFGLPNQALLLAAVLGIGLFIRVEAKARSPLVSLAMFRDAVLRGRLIMNVLVSTVMMATLVVGPFYLAQALGLEPGGVGLVMSVGPLMAAAAGVPAGRTVDHVGVKSTILLGLAAMLAGCGLLWLLPARFGLPAYVGPLVVITVGYAFFQAANNTGIMANVRADQRGVVSGLLNLSRNLGLITGASVMGAVFAWASASANVATAEPGALATGLRVTFGVAALLVTAAIVIGTRSGAPARRLPATNNVS